MYCNYKSNNTLCQYQIKVDKHSSCSDYFLLKSLFSFKQH